MTDIYYDFEFLEDGHTIEIISAGFYIPETGREYYAVNSEMPMDRMVRHPWLLDNVIPQLPFEAWTATKGECSVTHSVTLNLKATEVKPRFVIANEVRDLILSVRHPRLWAWYGAYDHVALCQLWGAMADLPEGVPMWTNDIRQVADELGVSESSMPQQPAEEHNALADARYNYERHRYLRGLPRAE